MAKKPNKASKPTNKSGRINPNSVGADSSTHHKPSRKGPYQADQTNTTASIDTANTNQTQDQDQDQDQTQTQNPTMTILHSANESATVDYLTMFQSLIRSTSRDSNGFLTYYLDHNYIPQDFYKRALSKQTDFINTAKIEISNTEGYPTINFHTPVWNKLEHEPDIYFDAFRAYLLSPDRSLTKALDTLPRGFTPYTLKEAHTLFYWQERAKSYDIYLPVAASRLRDQRTIQMEDQHFRIGHTLLEQLSAEIQKRSEENEQRPWQGLTSADIIRALTSATEMQRVAVGLPAKGPKMKEDGGRLAPNIGQERATRESAKQYTGEDEFSATPAQQLRNEVERVIASDPNLAEELQKTAIQVMLKARAQNAEEKPEDVPVKEE